MSGYYPDGVTQGDIDRSVADDDPPCPHCGAAWDEECDYLRHPDEGAFMPTTPTPEKTRQRSAPARKPDLVLAAMHERIGCIPENDETSVHLRRLNELCDELKRSIAIVSNGNGGSK